MMPGPPSRHLDQKYRSCKSSCKTIAHTHQSVVHILLVCGAAALFYSSGGVSCVDVREEGIRCQVTCLHTYPIYPCFLFPVNGFLFYGYMQTHTALGEQAGDDKNNLSNDVLVGWLSSHHQRRLSNVLIKGVLTLVQKSSRICSRRRWGPGTCSLQPTEHMRQAGDGMAVRVVRWP